MEITIEEMRKRKGWKLGTMADAMGVSIALLSKIKNGTAPITCDTQEAFRKVFGADWTLVGGEHKWKEECKAVHELNARLIEENNQLKKEMQQLRLDVSKMSKYFNKIIGGNQNAN